MHIELTEKELTKMFSGMSSKEITDYLLGEGLSLNPDKKNFMDVPAGIYRRVAGQDLIRKNAYGQSFNWVDQHNDSGEKQEIEWTLLFGGGDWWVQVLDSNNNPIVNGYRFQMNEEGERIA